MFNHLENPNLPEIIQLNKSNGKRFYQVPNGQEYPSITTVLGAKEKPHLVKWRAMLGDKKADAEMNRCATRGTAIHLLAEQYLNNETGFTKGIKAEYVNDFNKLKMLLNRLDNIRAQEISLYSDRLKVAGTVDVVCEYNGVLSIVDFKTSTNNKTKDMVGDYFMQMCFYAIAWYELTGEAIENIVILMSVERGLMPLVFTAKIEEHIAELLKRISEFE